MDSEDTKNIATEDVSLAGEDAKGKGSSAVADRADAKSKHPMEGLLKQRADAGMYLKAGDIVQGTFLEREGNRLFIDLGHKGVGIVFGKEFYEAQHAIKGLKKGDMVTAKVVEVESAIEIGYPELSLKEAGREKLWTDLRDTMNKKTPLNLRIKEANRGGVLLEYNGVQGFLPVSQLSQKNYPRVEGGNKERIFEELKKFVGKELQVKIIDIDPTEEKLIFSEREFDGDAVREIVSKHTVGEEIEGEITATAPFGAFVRFSDGLEGLIHVSELDWQLVENPKDVVTVGEKVKVKIIGIEGGKVSLSLKALKEDPWLKLPLNVKKGDTVKGVATKFNPFGAFVKITFHPEKDETREVQGLVHISEFGTEAKMKETLEIGKEHDFVVSAIDVPEHRMSLMLPENAKRRAENAEAEQK